jgi:hypothetical protein
VVEISLPVLVRGQNTVALFDFTRVNLGKNCSKDGTSLKLRQSETRKITVMKVGSWDVETNLPVLKRRENINVRSGLHFSPNLRMNALSQSNKEVEVLESYDPNQLVGWS